MAAPSSSRITSPDAVQMANAAVRAHDAFLVAEVLARFERIADAGLHPRAVIRVDEADEFIERALEPVRRDAIDVKEPLRPGNPVLHDIPRPTSEIGKALGFEQMNIGVGKRRPCAP